MDIETLQAILLAQQGCSMPARTKETIDNYVSKRWRPGHFVGAVLANDLKGAVAAADAENQAGLFETVRYIYNNVPQVCWGSYENVTAWLNADPEDSPKSEA